MAKNETVETVDAITCPHCKKLHSYDDLLEVGDMSGEFEMDCNFCEGKFHVDFCSMFYFITTKK